ncbi:putative acylaminoacyl-peptidase transcription factor WD40-like family [Helianthus annuus]|uniref:acylaminoacyl-peptidase n=1 Tax=Helianthus annuus TaxID=4232 RepID=A0A251T0F0_HELAN|nr:acylamino-acid-releasing enzyme [Helianthus annuus]KAF5778995.1 putative acylaminoacyl-peptidase [Helianthus annuus]KAJ0490330.1 putative acylaminoacyl-peptidase transcription factor WD40-like family [Helianthus annuus]KAJ0494500.1 putative acylaminoacyl-peptidase transcription factor WD40-like family [Helianthus annuus]KAJ0506249.1 putative acylaminoacyl-peptidase transcription factor WD40-like family [Helianthus annuus]KAJ0675921.1 putative acylaminoacyl-peptidase transcription factor WD4
MLLLRYLTNTSLSTYPAFHPQLVLSFPKPPPRSSSPHRSLLRFSSKRLRVCSGMDGSGVSAVKEVAASVEVNMEEEYVSLSKLYKEFTSMSTIDKAWTFKSSSGQGSRTMFSITQPNLLANKRKKLMLSSVISENSNGGVDAEWAPFPIDVTGASLMVPSPSGSKLLVVRNPENDSPTVFEIWGPFQLEKEIRVPQSKHGSVYADGWFQGISWNSDESAIAYVAEEPSVQKPSFSDTAGYKKDAGPNSTDKDLSSWKGQGDWEEDWGEAYSGKRQPALFVININSGDVRAVQGIGRSLSVGQVVWAPTTKGSHEYLIFVGWPSDVRKFGMIYCYNRPCAIYAVKSPSFESEIKDNAVNDDASVINLTQGTSSAFYPRFTPDGKFLVFFSAKTCIDTGAHCATQSIHKTVWNNEGEPSPAKIVDVVPVVMCPDEDGCFPGIYCFNMLSKPWLSDGSTMILSSVWGSAEVILSVNVQSGKVTRITPSNSNHSWSLLTLNGDNILVVCSSLVDVPQIKYGSITKEESKDDIWRWLDVSSPTSESHEKVKSLLSSLQFDILKIPVKNVSENLKKGACKPIEAIYVSSKSKREDCDPMIVILHGGPHSVSLSSFSKTSGFLASIGYSLLIVNYRGSIGYGEEALQSLLGKVGSQDVNDVLTAVDHAVDKGLANPSKITVLGGSHGGFLTTHLIGQAPDKFAAAAARNPVCNLALMVGTSDIPDWCFVEAFGSLGVSSYTEAPSPEHISLFHEKSPIAHISKVKTPTLFLLGAKDLRVPVSNGLQFARALKEKGVVTKVIVFPEDIHPINRPQSDFESFVNIGVWFKKYCK